MDLGTRQGSILVPLIFTVFNNYLPDFNVGMPLGRYELGGLEDRTVRYLACMTDL